MLERSSRANPKQMLRRWGPWLIGIAIVVLIATRVPFAQLRRAMSSGPHLTLIAAELAITAVVLATDSLSTWIGLRALQIRWSLGRVTSLRGATYLLFLINYAVGQGGFGYYLYRAGEPALRAIGATLFLIGTTLATLLLVTFCTGAVAGVGATNPQLWWTLVIGTGAFVGYLVIIQLRVGFLVQRQVLAPLFDARIAGHALAIAGRIPHVVAIVLSYWVAMLVWGISVPFTSAVTLMPAVALAAALPLAPAGLGTTQVALVYYFASYAPGVTGPEREASLLAFALVHFVYGMLASLVVGLACWIAAKRTGALPTSEPQQDAPS